MTGLTATEIRKMTKYQDLKNEVKRIQKLKKAEIIPVIVGATGTMKKTLAEYLKIIPGNIKCYKRATSGGCQIGSVKILKKPLERDYENETLQFGS